MKSEKSIEKMLKKHYKKAERAVDLPPHKNVTVGGQTVSLYAPRRNIFVSAAAFAIYAIGLVSMVTLFILAGGKAGLFQPEDTDDRGVAGSVSDTDVIPKTHPPVTSSVSPTTNNVYEEIKLGEQLEFVDEVWSDADLNRIGLSMENLMLEMQMDDKAMIAVITPLDIQFSPYNNESTSDIKRATFSYMVEKVLVAGDECTQRKGNVYTGLDECAYWRQEDGGYKIGHYCFQIPLTDIGGQYVVYIEGNGILHSITSNLNGRHLNLDWSKYAEDAVACEAECIATYTEQIEEVLTYIPTTDGVEEFIAALIDKEGRFKFFADAECYNITTSRIRKEIGGEIFRFMDDPSLRTYSNEAYLFLNGEIYELTKRTDNGYLTSAIPCDFDGDRNMDIIYTCSNKDTIRNVTQTNVYVFNTVTKQKTEIFSTDTAPKAVQRTLVVTEGDLPDGRHFDLCFPKYVVEGATTFVASPVVCGKIKSARGIPEVIIDTKYDDPPEPDPTYSEWAYHPYDEVWNVENFKNIRQNLMQDYFERMLHDYSVFSGFDYSEEDNDRSIIPINILDSDVTTKWCDYNSSIEWCSAVVWSMSKPVYVDGYIMINANDQAAYKDRSPTKWRLYGANELPVDHMYDDIGTGDYYNYFDAETVPEGWVLIDAVDASDSKGASLLPDDNSYEIAFKAENPGTYKYFMLLIDEVEGSRFQMAEFVLYGYEHRQTGERIQAIRDASYEQYGIEMGIDAYYGTYNGKDVFLHMSWGWAETEIEVAGCVFWEAATFEIFVFDNGEFIILQDAYERGLLTAEQIGDIAALHAEGITLCEVHDYGNSSELDLYTAKMIIAENDDIVTILQEFARFREPDYIGGSDVSLIEYWLDEYGDEKILIVVEEEQIYYIEDNGYRDMPYEVLYGEGFNSNRPVTEPLTDEKRKEIESAWLADNGEELEWSYLYGVLYYGTYGDCIVMLDASGACLTAESELIVASSRFKFTTSFGIAVYHDGKFIGLKKAYESGLLSAEQIAVISECHVAALKDYWGMLYYEAFEKDWYSDDR